jgi:rhodanese-related sulfurtransferase/DNA-binding transcriptional ArsR family regulator
LALRHPELSLDTAVFNIIIEYMSKNHRPFKDQLFEQFARIGKALANPHRLELVDLLAQGERSVEDLAREAAMSVANTSRHLQELRAARLVEVRREGLYGYYRLADERVFEVWRAMRELGEARLAEIDRLVETYLTNRGALEAVCAEELLAKTREGDVVVLDVRPEEEYRAGHIPGARSVPLERLEAYLEEIPEDQEIVAYCRGPYCVFSDEAVSVMTARGYQASRLTEGFPEWRAAGYPVESRVGRGSRE